MGAPFFGAPLAVGLARLAGRLATAGRVRPATPAAAARPTPAGPPDDLGQNAHSDLFRLLGAQVEPGGSADAADRVIAEPEHSTARTLRIRRGDAITPR